jgi:hypothetical protein
MPTGLGGQNRTAIIGFGDQGNAIIRHRDTAYGSTLPSRAMVSREGATLQCAFIWWGIQDSNLCMMDSKSIALPAWLIPYMDTNC